MMKDDVCLSCTYYPRSEMKNPCAYCKGGNCYQSNPKYKPEEHKPEERKPEEHKPEEHKPEDMQIGGDHYKRKAIQPWAAMEDWMTPEEFAGFLKGNAIKYLARCNDKGGLEDLKKARHYLDKLINLMEQK